MFSIQFVSTRKGYVVPPCSFWVLGCARTHSWSISNQAKLDRIVKNKNELDRTELECETDQQSGNAKPTEVTEGVTRGGVHGGKIFERIDN